MSQLHAGPARHGVDAELLERSGLLAALGEHLDAAVATRAGRLVFVTGEAGAGKTSLVRRFAVEREGGTRVLRGACDSLITPRALGPLLDVAEQTGGELADTLAAGGRPHDVVGALLRELQASAPTVLVVEDAHWADEATLDVLRLAGRRIEAAPALVLVTLRDDELDRAHPLRLVLGELATAPAVHRLALPPLSLAAVRELAEPRGVDAEELHRKTGGNPFFVTEALEAGADELPSTVRDAVLARAGRLDPEARRLLEVVAVVPPHAELALLEALAGADIRHLDACLASGMLRADGDAVSFRHELARLAVEESVAPDHRLVLHRNALRTLSRPSRGAPDPARLAHHAEAAGDADAVLEHAPAAAERAARVTAHREAAAHYARALRFAAHVSERKLAELLERRAYECYLAEQIEEALEACEAAIARYRSLGDALREGDCGRLLSRLLWCLGRTAEAERSAHGAVALLETAPPGKELALAYSNVAQLRMIAQDAPGAVEWGTKAIALAERVGDAEALSHALNNVGSALLRAGSLEGRALLERSLEIARAAGLEEHVLRALNNLSSSSLDIRDYAVADRYSSLAIEYLNDHGVTYWLPHSLALRARSAFEQGRWTEATQAAELVLARPSSLLLSRVEALVVVGRVRARRGDPGVGAALDEALALAAPTGELQQIGPVAAARAEAALLAGEPGAVEDETAAAFALARMRDEPWLLGELALLRRRAGIEEPAPESAAEPFALELAGDRRAAAERWTALGCPYETASALAEADEPDALRRALAELERLGARPAATAVVRRLRERLARGPRPSTRENSANLTARELEVLELVARGLRNAEIADRLVLSQRTVDHHVSAILRKLDARTRAEAGHEAVRLGLVDSGLSRSPR